MSPRAYALTLLTIALALTIARTATAQITVHVGAREWAATVAALQTDRTSEGTVLPVSAHDSGVALPCDMYTLSLDAAGAAAFAIGACDRATGTTSVRLVHREALFGPGTLVARPLVVAIYVAEVRHGGAFGGASPAASSELACHAAIRPYVDDLLHGGRVQLTPERYVLRMISSGIVPAPSADGWQLGATSGTVSAEYEVVDRATGEVVLHERSTMHCERVVVGTGVPAVAPRADSALASSRVAVVPHTRDDGCNWRPRPHVHDCEFPARELATAGIASLVATAIAVASWYGVATGGPPVVTGVAIVFTLLSVAFYGLSAWPVYNAIPVRHTDARRAALDALRSIRPVVELAPAAGGANIGFAARF